VLDALDECKGTQWARMIGLLTDFYQTTKSSHSGQGCLKFLVTSRPYDGINRGFNVFPSSLPTIRLRGEDESDKIGAEINLVIRAQVVKLAYDLNLKSQIKIEIENILLHKEYRTYLWLHFAIEDIYQTYRDSL